MIRVLIADDHKVVRQGLRFLLSSEPGIDVAGEAADGAAALDAIRALRPDVVLLDLFMPRMDGLAVLAAMREAGLTAAVLILTSSADDQHLVQAIKAGALSYLPKTAGVDQVIEAVRGAARDRRPAGATHPAGDRRAQGPGAGPLQPGDRAGAVGLRGDRQEPCVQHPRQAGPRRPHPGGHLRPAASPDPAGRGPWPVRRPGFAAGMLARHRWCRAGARRLSAGRRWEGHPDTAA